MPLFSGQTALIFQNRFVISPILSILADDKPHHITELARLPYPSQDINATLALLIREEYVFQQDGYLQRATT